MKEYKSQTIKRAARDARTLGKRELAMMLEAVADGVAQVEHQHLISTGEQYRWSLAVARALKLAESLAAEIAEREKASA